MRKFTLFFIALSISTALFAQQPFGKNATWYVEYSNEFGYSGYREIAYSHDTLIDNESWQVFSESGAREIRTGPKQSDLIQWKYTGARFNTMFMTRNDSVFVKNTQYNYTQFIYDYNAKVGDKWQFAPWDTGASCLDTPQVTVIAIGYDTIQGQAIKYWELEDEMDTIFAYSGNPYRCSSSRCMGGKMYERIGALLGYGGFYNFTSAPNMCNGGSFGLPAYTLRCYKDDSLNVNFGNKVCNSWAFIGIEENDALSQIQIFPNPASNYIRLSGMQNTNATLTWRIIDLQGKTLLKGILENNDDKIDVLGLSGGMYILELDGRKSLRFIVE